jgi:fructose-bisphosphate aldolase, class II
MAKGVDQMAKDAGADIPIALYLERGNSLEHAKSCIDSGFSSDMLDRSHHPFDKNAEISRQVVAYAHERNVTVSNCCR